MAGLPVGTVTFLFTDVEQSTQTVALLGDERYADLQDAHRELLREAFDVYGGVVVGTEGDALFVVFQRAGDAAAAALAGQRAIESHSWPGDARIRVRMGLHTGEALVRESNYVGHDVHKAKRIADAGHGGQILLSHTTSDLVAGRLPDGVTISSLGHHRFKDLGEPQPVFQLTAAGLQSAFPPLRTIDTATQNLPVQLTSFVGRETELAEIKATLAAHRLVTLTGVGGSGKTRVAIQAAGQETDGSPDGVFFCDLSQISDEDTVVAAVVRALNIDPGDVPSSPPADVLRGYLARRRALLVLDNCEHLVDAVAAIVDDLLTSCLHLRILATSREALAVEGEHTWSVPSLDVAADGARLFVERAAAVRGTFDLTDDNIGDIRAICTRLDGMPLAIELAAAQTGHLSPHQIVERLDDRFALLTGGRRRVQRQQTLQAAMDWSWDLLADRDRALLARLTCFQGGCALESAEAVCGDGIDVVGGLRSLVAKSLVVADDRGESVRYRLLETVRLFAEDKLVDQGEAERFRTRHREYFTAWARDLFEEEGPFVPVLASGLGDEQDNIRAALRWSEMQKRPDLVAELLCSTVTIWWTFRDEGARRVRAALETDLDPGRRGRVLALLSGQELAEGKGATAVDRAREAVTLLGDEPSVWLFLALQTLANQTAIEGIATQDEERVEAALAFAHRCADVGQVLPPRWTVLSHLTLGGVLMMMLRHKEAAEAYAHCARESAGGGQTTYLHIEGLAVARHIRPDAWTDTLEAAFRDARHRYLSSSTVSRTPAFLALELAEIGRIEDAYATLGETIDSVKGLAPVLFIRALLVYSAVIAGIVRDWERAARLLGAAMQRQIILSAAGYALYRHWVPIVRSHLDPQRARQLRDEGRAMTLDEAMAYAVERP